MGEMTPRERLRSAISLHEPDRVPLDLGSLATTIEVAPYEEVKKILGITEETKCFVRMHVEPPGWLLEKFKIDTRYLRIKGPQIDKTKVISKEEYIDEWGIRWFKPPSSYYFDPVDYPLKKISTIAELEKYDWPDIADPGRVENLAEEARLLFENTEYALVANTPLVGVFEQSWMLRGFQQFLADLIINRSLAEAILAKLTELQIELYGAFLDKVGKYIDVVMASDDLGTQNSLLISPEIYRRLIKPYHKELFGFIKSKTKAKLFLHSCGSIKPLIPDLIEVGVDILNPIQPLARDMDSAALKKEFGKDLSFWGAIDTQRVLAFGSKDQVAEEVRMRIDQLASGGGYILAPAHNIQPGVPPENIIAMYEAAAEYGGK